jgi:hypothetical protein
MRAHDLWASGRAYYSKQPSNAADPRTTVDLYPGFAWSVVLGEDGRLFVCLDPTVRYIDRRWFTVRLNGDDPMNYRARHFLYHFGHQWYMVQFWGLTGLSVSEQRFLPNGGTQAVDVLSYTHERWRGRVPAWVRDLDPASPAIVYRYPGNQQERYGALALCKLALSTTDTEAAGLHRRAIVEPARRLAEASRHVDQYFQQACLGDRSIHVSATPLGVQRRVFAVPLLRFGHERVLAITGANTDADVVVTDRVALEQLGRRRLSLLLDRTAGALDQTPFAAQYVLMPQSLPRSVNEDFEQRFVVAMEEVSGRSYAPRLILYDDRGATTLYQQVQAIRNAVAGNTVQHGYVLLVLPERAKPDLHNYIKRTLWPDLQLQCAMAAKIRSYYQSVDGNSTFRPAEDCIGRLTSYVRNCALGMLVVNRKWPWTLAMPLHYDVYIGIDVLNRLAGLTFAYDHAQHIVLEHQPTQQQERLSARQVRRTVADRLRQDLPALGLRPRSIVVHRDGRSFASELNGLRAAISELVADDLLPSDVLVGAVDIRKTSADHLRLVEGRALTSAQNPTVGSWLALDPHAGIVCTTGSPFRFPGTSRPLSAVIVTGNLRIGWVLEDVFSLAQLGFTAPDKCVRLPLTIKLADDFLEPIAGDADDEEARYGEEPLEVIEAE